MTTLPPGRVTGRARDSRAGTELIRAFRKKQKNLGEPRFRGLASISGLRFRGPCRAKPRLKSRLRSEPGAGNETRTRDPDLGKVVLYQLSYSRVGPRILRTDRQVSTLTARLTQGAISAVRAGSARPPARRRSPTRWSARPQGPAATRRHGTGAILPDRAGTRAPRWRRSAAPS